MKKTIGIILLVASLSAHADVRDEIISRCRSSMGEYGSAMVKACVDQDIEAINALAAYPEKAKPFIARCQKQMNQYGWAMIKACVDQDIDAEKSLGGY